MYITKSARRYWSSMLPPAHSADEPRRLAALRGYLILDTPPDPALDQVTALAAEIVQVPIAAVSLVDADRQWFKARLGLAQTQFSRAVSFCGHVIADGAPLIVEDARDDRRFADSPLVLEDPQVRFYAGFPLSTRSGFVLGTLCVIDRQPRQLTASQLRSLEMLAGIATHRIEALRESALAHHVLDGAPGLLGYWDIGGRCRFASAAHGKWLGTGADLTGRTMDEIYGDHYPQLASALRGEACVFEVELVLGGTPRACQAYLLPHLVAGEPVGVVSLVADISARKAIELELAATLPERESLLRALHHRVRNNLQVIVSLINMQIRKHASPAIEAALRGCQRRVMAISAVHDQLCRTGAPAHVRFSDYAQGLIDGLLRGQDEPSRVVVHAELADVRLPIDQAMPCGLILNELVTNALEHGLPPGTRGTLRLSLAGAGAGWLALTVSDNGVGLPAGFALSTSSSLGLFVVRTLAEQLTGSLEVSSAGETTFRVRFPFADAC
jgi:two-component sensor histidine kinase/PAS domain-containing protein